MVVIVTLDNLKSTDHDLLLKAYYVLRTFHVLLLRLLGTLHGMNK